MIPRFGRTPESGRRYVIRPGAYAILLRGDELLVTYQHAPHDEFQLPGGGIDPGESPVSALHREVYEETGYTMTTPRRLGAFRRFTYMPEYDKWAEKVCAIYVARPALRLGPPLETDHEPVWMPAKVAAKVLANEGDRQFVRTFLL
ncbi:8-oxo-dGTP diphosphatase [Shimia isoporae]|uniref:8-oxo-dGTP diphosphatase n=1 Tax=Shimia isoporae TaxID=647720 RepID=A0A4R1N9S0_9RHOB|nr:NUDIX hydrolase [Shimia isoporae]TCK99884.1 8-oxo-dGTP diphosphatase [Shimia isoporae]